MYHETLWSAASAAAPVIALAAVVGLNDITGEAYRATEWSFEHPPLAELDETHQHRLKQLRRGFNRAQNVAAILGLANISLQTGVLGFALASLASQVDELPVAVAVIFEVVGLMAITVAALAAMTARGWRRRIIRVQAGHSDIGAGTSGAGHRSASSNP
jgi:hypothetical protein